MTSRLGVGLAIAVAVFTALMSFVEMVCEFVGAGEEGLVASGSPSPHPISIRKLVNIKNANIFLGFKGLTP
jgi:hypothetical protein